MRSRKERYLAAWNPLLVWVGNSNGWNYRGLESSLSLSLFIKGRFCIVEYGCWVFGGARFERAMAVYDSFSFPSWFRGFRVYFIDATEYTRAYWYLLWTVFFHGGGFNIMDLNLISSSDFALCWSGPVKCFQTVGADISWHLNAPRPFDGEIIFRIIALEFAYESHIESFSDEQFLRA